MDVHPTKNVSIGIDPYPNDKLNWYIKATVVDLTDGPDPTSDT